MAGNDSYTKSLLHLNTDLTDSAVGGSHIWTAYGNAVISSAWEKFGAGSLLLKGTNSYIAAPDSDDWYPTSGTSPFTFDIWLKHGNVTVTQLIFSQRDPSSGVTTNNFEFDGVTSTLQFTIYNNGMLLNFTTPYAPALNSEHHVALVRIDGGNAASSWRIFVDGVSQTLTLADGAWNAALQDVTSNFYLGWLGVGGSYFYGYMDEKRWSKDIARWTTNFTPQTGEYSTIAGWSKTIMGVNTPASIMGIPNDGTIATVMGVT